MGSERVDERSVAQSEGTRGGTDATNVGQETDVWTKEDIVKIRKRTEADEARRPEVGTEVGTDSRRSENDTTIIDGDGGGTMRKFEVWVPESSGKVSSVTVNFHG